MPLVAIAVDGRSYDIACGEGEQERVLQLAALLNDRVTGLRAAAGGAAIEQSKLLVMVGLMLADELDETRGNGSEDALAGTLARLSTRIEAIAARLERD